MSIGKEILATLRDQWNVSDYRKIHWEGTFEQYLNIVVANSEGLLARDDQVRTRFMVQCVATGDTGMQTGYEAPGRSVGFELFDEVFSEGATFVVSIAGTVAAGPFEGRAAVVDFIRSTTLDQTDQRRHVITNVRLAGGDKATSTLTLLVVDNGELIVTKSSRTGFEPLRRYEVATSATWAQPAISGSRFFIKDATSVALWTLDAAAEDRRP